MLDALEIDFGKMRQRLVVLDEHVAVSGQDRNFFWSRQCEFQYCSGLHPGTWDTVPSGDTNTVSYSNAICVVAAAQREVRASERKTLLSCGDRQESFPEHGCL